MRMVLGEGLRLVEIGVAVGLGLALVTGRARASLPFETAPTDPLTLAGGVPPPGGARRDPGAGAPRLTRGPGDYTAR